MDLTFQVPMQYCSIALDLASIASHIHNWVLFLLWLRLFILSGVISPLISSIYWAPTGLGSSSFSVLSFCLFILFMGFSRQEYCQLKKDVQLESCEFSLGQNKDCSPGDSISDSSGRLLQSGSGGSQYIRFQWRGSSIPWSTHFTKGFLLVMRIWRHPEGI